MIGYSRLLPLVVAARRWKPRDGRERVEARDERERVEARDERERVEARDGREEVEARDERERVVARDGRERVKPRDGRERVVARDGRERVGSARWARAALERANTKSQNPPMRKRKRPDNRKFSRPPVGRHRTSRESSQKGVPASSRFAPHFRLILQ